jgi:hypothetical protein
MQQEERLQASGSKDNAETKKAIGISRRRIIVFIVGGFVLAIPGFSAIFHGMNSRKIKVTIDGPFQRGLYDISESQIRISNKPGWFSVDGVTIAYYDFEPFAKLSLSPCSAPDLPKKPIPIEGRIIGRSGKTLAHAMESYNVSEILEKHLEVNMGMVTAKIVPSIEHYIYWTSDVQIKDISRIEWEVAR